MKAKHPYDIDFHPLRNQAGFPKPPAERYEYRLALIGFLLFNVIPTVSLLADEPGPQQLLTPMQHFRSGARREWNNFPEQAGSDHLDLSFEASPSPQISTLSLRQQDVKQLWSVRLNGKMLGRLQRDENDMRVYFPVPAGILRKTGNHLKISSTAQRGSDDIRVGELSLDTRNPDQVLREARLHVTIIDRDTGKATPCRLTIINAAGSLQSVGAVSNHQLAVRPGIVYTASGSAQIGLPAGDYTLYAGRGFEYSLATARVSLQRGAQRQVTLTIHREVDTREYVACDPHVHTLTHSGHGDATVSERMITLAGEGIELPIATDHNRHVDHTPFARQLNLQSWFTPVIGNEVTTPVGHFNIFPVAAGASVPDHTGTDWPSVFKAIGQVRGAQVVILNHGRDLHSQVRPLGPAWHHALVGENLRDWPIGFNAMEIVNSAATQSDSLQLFHDWLGLLNRGQRVAPIGSSDSHDVGRHFVGQARTYIRTPDREAGNIDITAAARQLVAGRVLMSYGLIADLTVNQTFLPGDCATIKTPQLRIEVCVRGPHWVQAQQVSLFANGQRIAHHTIAADADRPGEGIIWRQSWQLPRPSHDVHLVALATGPGIRPLYWPTAKPYQPTSEDPRTTVVGCSGAIWLDVDGDGKWTSAYEIARQLVAAADGDLPGLLATLVDYDAAVVAQAAHLLHRHDEVLLTQAAQRAIRAASPDTKAAIAVYLQTWRETQQAQNSP
ncbi:MAG: CehA/McbA family metallohydrolase [Planctomycetota bacterium]|nr:CehA/McbA family metallohydrolase [Planctomycetota bacterium]